MEKSPVSFSHIIFDEKMLVLLKIRFSFSQVSLILRGQLSLFSPFV